MKPEQFVKTLMASKNLVLEDISREEKEREVVTIVKSIYRGYRTDRIRDRNDITNAFGFPHCSGREVMSADGSGSGTFLADILVSYGKDYWFYDDGKNLELEHNITAGGKQGYIAIGPKKV